MDDKFFRQNLDLTFEWHAHRSKLDRQLIVLIPVAMNWPKLRLVLCSCPRDCCINLLTCTINTEVVWDSDFQWTQRFTPFN